jgi:predicted amidohydrolase
MKPAADLNIALLQLDLVWENPDANIAAIDTMMRDPQIDSKACDILVLPEMWATGFTMNPAQQGLHWSTSCAHSQESWPAPLHAMQRWSRQHNTAVV